MIELALLKKFCKATEKTPWTGELFSTRRYTFAVGAAVMVRVARRPEAPEHKLARRAEEFLEFHWPRSRCVTFEAWPVVAPNVKDGLLIGGRFYSVEYVRLIGALPNARAGIFRGEKAQDAAEVEAAGRALPLPFIAGEGRGASAEVLGLLMPLRMEAVGK